MDEKLSGCPFCGSEVNSVALGRYVNFGMCDACDAQGPLAKTEVEAIAAWNRRASPWRPIPETPTPGEAPWDGGPWLLNDHMWTHAVIGFWVPEWSGWGDGNGAGFEAPTFYAPIAPLPAPPNAEEG